MQEQKLLRRKRKATFDGNKNALASVCIDLAELYCQEGRYEAAIDQYIILADIYKEMGKQMDYARANRMIGEAYTQLREYDKALQYQQIHLKTAKDQDDKLEEQRALATIGHTHLTSFLDTADNSNKKPLNLAYKSFMKSLLICEKLTGITKYEHKDMTARLLANLGVVEECQGNYDKGIELVQKSINICKSHDLYEQLERGYTLLGSLHVRKKEYNKAINQYNLGMEVAGRLKNKELLMCASLSAKADILIRLADYHGAKTVLCKAYKLKNPSIIEQEAIKRNLKIAAAMCYAEESLLITSDTDYKTKTSLYEKLGDGACKLKNYPSAIEYYQKMLEAAKSNGESGSELGPCYISLAETYRDDGQLDMAIKFFQHEYNISKGNAKESVPTLLNIADCMEDANHDVTEIENIYMQARDECLSSREKRLECKVLSRYILMLRKIGRLAQAAQLEDELNKMDFVNSDDENSPEQATPDIGDDISIKDITDISDESDTEKNTNKRKSTRKRGKSYSMKKNNKGETQLHTACINGKVLVVRNLLDQGHVVNVRDNCGWLPIHEACICGHVEIVTMLIEKGASINDRGGTLCNGMTPLHDAATNGHLEVMQLLLDHGASSIAKNDIGQTPLHVLQNWRTTQTVLDPEQLALYNNLLQRLTQDLEKLGHRKDILMEDEKNTAIVLEEDKQITQKRAIRRASTVESQKAKTPESIQNKIGNLRRNVSYDADLDVCASKSEQYKPISEDSESNDENVDVDVRNSNSNANATDEYKRVMEDMRHPHRDFIIEKKRKLSENRYRSAHVETDDNWLEDDLCSNKYKKRKMSTADDLINSTGTRRRSSGSLTHQNSSSSLKSRGSLDDELNIANEFFNSEFDANEVEVLEQNDDDINEYKFVTHNSPSKKKVTQSSLMDSGFVRHCSLDLTTTTTQSNSKSVKLKRQTKLTNFGHTRNVESDLRNPFDYNVSQQSNTNLSNIFNSEPTFSIDVRIDGKLYRVPVLATEIHTRTIKWLADEASKRYSKKECMKPSLELETKNGAILAEDDFISILFSAGSVQAEEVQARILKWNLPPLSTRYTEACMSSDITPNENIIQVLQETSASLNLSDLNLQNKNVVPLFKSINRQINLYHLNLSGNFISNESVQSLCLSLPSLDNLTILNLSLNHLTTESLRYFADMFVQSSKSILENLASLDLSYNPLGDESLQHLAIITRYLKLQTLNLTNVDFTKDIFNVIVNRNVDLSLDYILNFDVSYNRLGKLQIMSFLSWLKPQNLETLNISSSSNDEEGLIKEVINWLQNRGSENLNLETLNLGRCLATDAEIYELLRVLLSASKLRKLDLSYNKYLTSLSLRRLIQHYPSFAVLNLTGCENILKYFEDCEESTWNSQALQCIKLSFDHENSEEKNILVDMWNNKYKEKSKITDELRGFIELSVKDN